MKYNQHPNFISQPKHPTGALLLMGALALGALTTSYLLPSQSSSLATISIPVTGGTAQTQYAPTREQPRVQQLTQEAIAGWVVTPLRATIAYERGSLRATRYTATGERDASFTPPQVSSLIRAQLSTNGTRALVHTRVSGNEVVLVGPIERIEKHPDIGAGAVLSPDGSHVAFFTIEEDASTSIWATGILPTDTPRHIASVRLQNITLSWVDSTRLVILSTNTQQSKNHLSLLNTRTKEFVTLVSKKDRIEYNPAIRNNTILVSWYEDGASSPVLAHISLSNPLDAPQLPAQTSAKKCGWASDEVVICGVPRSGSLQSSLNAEMNSTRDDIVIISIPSLTTRVVSLSEQSTPLSVILPTGTQQSTSYELVFQNAFDQKLYTATIPTRGDE